MKKLLKKIYINISKIVMPIFYKKEYLKGKHFNDNIKGWQWCWRNLFMQKIVGYNRSCPFPATFRSDFGNWKNISWRGYTSLDRFLMGGTI